MTYEQGFSEGERDAFHDNRTGQFRQPPADKPRTAHQRGYWDGYLPRSVTWRRRVVQPQGVQA